jgi:site-specific DNA-methyltransferase (adenine-specific)
MWKGLRDIPNGVILGDCLKVMPRLPTGSVDLILTDPPYLVNFKPKDGRPYPNDRDDSWLVPAFREMYRLLKPDAFLVSFYGWWKVHRFMQAWLAAGFRPAGHIVWTKHYRSNSGYLHYRHEQAYLLTKGAPRPRVVLNDTQDWRYSGNRFHPTQKPVTVIEPLVGAYSAPQGLVFDPFAGSGATLVAAQKLGRRYLGIEMVREYAESAAARLNRQRPPLFTPEHILPPMSYMEEVDRWLETLLADVPEDKRFEVKRAIKDRLLESYRNGQNAPATGERRPRGEWKGKGAPRS